MKAPFLCAALALAALGACSTAEKTQAVANAAHEAGAPGTASQPSVIETGQAVATAAGLPAAEVGKWGLMAAGVLKLVELGAGMIAKAQAASDKKTPTAPPSA